ncbi:hypothetical protein ACLOJK_037574, partial [Asimina triloba]
MSCDVKTIDNSPDPMPGWKSWFFFTQLTSKRDIWGVPKQWVEPLPKPAEFLLWCWTSARLFVAVSMSSLSEVKRRKEHSQKRVCPSAEGDNSVDLSLSTEDVFELSPIEGTSPVINHRDERRACSPHEQVARPKSRVAELLLEHKVALSERNRRYLEPRWPASKRCFGKATFSLLLWLNNFEAIPTAVKRSSSAATILKSLHMCGRLRGELAVE